MISIQQHLFNKVISHLHSQGLDYPCLLDPVAKTMCAVGFLYADLYSRQRLEDLVEEHYICDLDQSFATREVVKELHFRYPTVPEHFFHSLANMHDSAIQYQLSIDEAAELFALHWKLDYTSSKLKEKELPQEEEEQGDYEQDLPFPLAA